MPPALPTKVLQCELEFISLYTLCIMPKFIDGNYFLSISQTFAFKY